MSLTPTIMMSERRKTTQSMQKETEIEGKEEEKKTSATRTGINKETHPLPQESQKEVEKTVHVIPGGETTLPSSNIPPVQNTPIVNVNSQIPPYTLEAHKDDHTLPNL